LLLSNWTVFSLQFRVFEYQNRLFTDFCKLIRPRHKFRILYPALVFLRVTVFDVFLFQPFLPFTPRGARNSDVSLPRPPRGKGKKRLKFRLFLTGLGELLVCDWLQCKYTCACSQFSHMIND